MTAFNYMTRSEQRLEQLKALKRPLTDAESEELARVMHAVYERERRLSRLKQHRDEELRLLAKLRREAQLPDLS